jgi:DNA polymerase-3 subunit alpha
MSFTHLHLHDEYSYLDGFGKARQYAEFAASLGMKSLAITNHGNVDGCIHFQKECQAAGIKPIIGCEAYVVENMEERSKTEKRRHMSVWAKNEKGWVTLCRMLSKANMDGFYRRPRLDVKQLMSEDVSDLIFASACFMSMVYLPGHRKLIERLISDSTFYFEVMPHISKLQVVHNKNILDLANQFDRPIIATNDCHYPLKEDSKTQEVLLAIQQNRAWSDPKRWKFGIKGLHLRTEKEMRSAFIKQGVFTRRQIRRMLERTQEIVDACDLTIQNHDVDIPVPKRWEERPFAVLKRKCRKALRTKGLADHDEYIDRLKEELRVIRKKNIAGYFLLVHDIVAEAKKRGIGVGPGRGSVGGSLVAFLLKITQVNPIYHNLLFSRFISEDRIDYPDIDIDFEKSRRHEVFRYIEETYGDKHTCRISTDMRMKSRAAVRDVCRIFEIDEREAGQFAKAIPVYDDSNIDDALKTQEGKRFARNHPKALRYARKIEGQIRGSGRHAAAIVISPHNLWDGSRCVIVKRSKHLVANWNMKSCEAQGLMKLDILGLSTISVLMEAKRLIERRHSIPVVGKARRIRANPVMFEISGHASEWSDTLNFEKIPLDDHNVYANLSKGNTMGVFQLYTKTGTDIIKDIKPKEFEDLVAAVALNRPGPMDSGMTGNYILRRAGETWKKKHPIYEEITKDTYGLLIYQEQVMKVISRVAGMSESEADEIRRIIGKKRDKESFTPYRKKFIRGCVRNRTMSKAEASDLWAGFLKWSRYGFNKSHSVAYALIAYWTAWLGTNYAIEFICALLSYGEFDDKATDPWKTKQPLIDAAIDMGYKVLPPKYNLSSAERWEIQDSSVFAPFIEVNGIGEKVAKTCEEKKSGCEFIGFFGREGSGNRTKTEKILDALLADDPRAMPSKHVVDEHFRIRFTKPPKIVISKKQATLFSDSKCSKCSLSMERKRVCFSCNGKYNAAVIAEAPGRKEDTAGKGLVGPAGKEVWKGLAVHGIKRPMLHVGNICKCYPSETITPTKKHIQACYPFLKKELLSMDCRLILAFGNTALMAIKGISGGITKINGTAEYIDDLNAHVVWSVHPSSVLRSPRKNRPLFREALRVFAKLFKANKRG